MSASEKNRTQPAPLEKNAFQRVEKLIGLAISKLINAWQNQNAHTGIQFYIETDD